MTDVVCSCILGPGITALQRRALVREWEDGKMQIYYRGERIAFMELKQPVQASPQPRPPAPRPSVIRKAKKDHPWRHGIPEPAATGPDPGNRSAARWNTHSFA